MQQVVIMDKPEKQVVRVPFDKEGESVELLGLILGRSKGLYELEVLADHKVGKTFGRVVIRGVAQNGAQLAVKGIIKIDKEAQGVDDFLEMRMLVLDNQSSAIAEPQLEIEANEVKASHAATVGRLNQEGLFYLVSRGIPEAVATKLMVDGFLKQVVNGIQEVKTRQMILDKLAENGGNVNE